MHKKQIADVIIIGSGISALIAAERLSDEKNVMVITKSKKENSNSIWAQGGVAASIANNDHWESHYNDTMVAGSFHNNMESVKTLVQKGPKQINRLIDEGMKFDRDHDGRLSLGKEGAHEKRRILHAGGDATGKALIDYFLKRVQSKVKIVEDEKVFDLIVENKRCYGVKVKSKENEVKLYYANHIILATGGCGGLYTFTSNDPSITGDGLAIAYRSGVKLVDLEFIQFHPTMLCINGQGKGLISEAVRGEGAVLVTESGRLLMDGVHPQKDLAPRDVVAREINHAVLNGESVYLDIRMIPKFKVRFPTITELCETNGVDLQKGLIPVVPGAHFLMGGIRTDLHGRTNIEHLYAIGEVACTGVHGANRLASNSLLEGIVFAHELVDYIKSQASEAPVILEIEEETYKVRSLPSHEMIRKVMMNYVGIVRNEKELIQAKEWFEQFLSNKERLLPEELSIEEMSIINMLTAGWLITTSALARTESRGGHFREDYPNTVDSEWYQRQINRTNQAKQFMVIGLVEEVRSVSNE